MKIEFNQKDLKQWLTLVNQVKNGYYLSNQDIVELSQLNIRIMDITHIIHNKIMFNDLNKDNEK